MLTESNPARRLLALDGIRGVSVIIVIFSHMPLIAGNVIYNSIWSTTQALRLNYIFLDIFFVLSGFFITRALLEEQATSGTISISQF